MGTGTTNTAPGAPGDTDADRTVVPRLGILDRGRRRRLGTALDSAIEEYARVQVRQRELDDLVTEVVRLRCARVHDCRLCSSVRSVTGRQAGVDRTVEEAIDRYEDSDLPERVKVALRLTDAVVFTPAGLTPELRAQVLQHFSPAQATELVLDIVKWSSQKSLVALRMEPPVDPAANLLSFDENGDAHIGAG